MRHRKFTSSISRTTILILVSLTTSMFGVAPRSPSPASVLIAYYDFEGSSTAPYPVNLGSHVPALLTGPATNLVLTNLPSTVITIQPGLSLNAIGPSPNLTGFGIQATGSHSPADLDMHLSSAQGFQNMSMSFAISNTGNGYAAFQGFYSTNGGASFTQCGAAQVIPPTSGIIMSVNVPATANNAPSLVLRIELSQGQSNGAALQNVVDNIQVSGTVAVPTAAGVSVSGRILTPDGAGLRNARVFITGPKGIARAVTTSSFGYYTFNDVTAGATYMITVQSKKYRFVPRLVGVTDPLANIDLVGQ